MASLQRLLPRVRLTPRPWRAAFMSTGSTPDADVLAETSPITAPSPEDSLPEYFQEFATPEAGSSQPAVDTSLPPQAPPTAFPPPQTLNPLRDGMGGITAEMLAPKPTYAVYVQATSNNTIVTLTRPFGNPLLTLSGGKVGFKNSNKSSFEAASKCALGILQRLQEEQAKVDLRWELFLSGFGYGRDGFVRSLAAAEQSVRGALIRVTDRTPIRIGGTRAQKQKRR